jgi:hypothetical protein
VDHQDGGQLSGAGGRGPRQVAEDPAIAARRGHRHALGLQPGVVGLDLLAGGKVGAERRQQAGGRHAGPGEALCASQEAAAVDRAVHVGVEQDEQFLVEVVGGRARRHAGSFHGSRHQLSAGRRPWAW